MDISQPAVSQQIARLERRYGVRLFERLPAGVALTEDGERLEQLVGPLLKAIAHVDMEFSGAIGADDDSIAKV